MKTFKKIVLKMFLIFTILAISTTVVSLSSLYDRYSTMLFDDGIKLDYSGLNVENEEKFLILQTNVQNRDEISIRPVEIKKNKESHETLLRIRINYFISFDDGFSIEQNQNNVHNYLEVVPKLNDRFTAKDGWFYLGQNSSSVEDLEVLTTDEVSIFKTGGNRLVLNPNSPIKEIEARLEIETISPSDQAAVQEWITPFSGGEEVTLTFGSNSNVSEVPEPITGEVGSIIQMPMTIPQYIDSTYFFYFWSTLNIIASGYFTAAGKSYHPGENYTLTENTTLYPVFRRPTNSDFSFIENADGTVTAIGNLTQATNSSTGYICAVPFTYNDKPVTTFGYPLENQERYLTYAGTYAALLLPYSITAIGDNALYGTNIKQLNIPNTVKTIGNNAFRDASSLTSIRIPDSVTKIGNGAFKNCTNLTSVELPNQLSAISDNLFDSCTKLITINVPNSVSSIGEYAFYDCQVLENINFPNSLNAIGRYAFYNCQTITSIVIPNVVGIIGEYTFYQCNKVDSIELSSYITSIGDYAFYGIPLVSTIHLSENLKSIGAYAFAYCNTLSDCIIPESVTFIGERAFFSTRITATIIVSGTKVIEQGAYASSSSLQSIEVPNSVSIIEARAFSYCTSLENVKLNEGITTIGSMAFHYCSSLVSITIPASVTYISNNAFASCHNLKEVYIMRPASSWYNFDGTTIAYDAFSNNSKDLKFYFIDENTKFCYERAQGQGWMHLFLQMDVM